MKINFFIPGVICLALFAAHAQAQSLPEPPAAEEIAAPATDAANDLKAEQSQKLAAELIAFFEGLDKAVSDKSGDCPAVSDALRDYYAAHKEWIDSLDYVSVDIDAQAVDTIHNMAIELGKKLSACYDQKTIPELLKRFSKR
ncbi:MAG: hypothetical protein II767_11485 [Proteobacteria bacterium]|nr:hypothetical protein [Pseudomonadota bacterium]